MRIGRETAAELAAAHECGLIHRDIKPSNIWLETGRQRVKILDFGLVRLTGDETRLTQSGALMGTPAYMAPEQVRSSRAVDVRSDLFSLGCVLYRACTGQMAFQGPNANAVVRALVRHDPTLPEELNGEVPHALSQLVMKLLSKAPDQRYQSAQEVVEALASDS